MATIPAIETTLITWPRPAGTIGGFERWEQHNYGSAAANREDQMTETKERAGAITQGLATGVPNGGITLAFGDARRVDGVELVPVAFVTYGFGAMDESSRLGSGGGAGGVAIPLGAYAVGDGRLQFQPNTIALFSLAIPFIGTLGLTGRSTPISIPPQCLSWYQSSRCVVRCCHGD